MKKVIVIIITAGVIVLIFAVGCPIRRITGIPCPGCGMTRAFVSLIEFDFSAAFYFHPVFPLVILMIMGFVFVVFRYSYQNKKNVARLDSYDFHVMMDEIFSKLLTKIIICVYFAAFLIVYILRFSTLKDLEQLYFLPIT